MGRIGFNLVRVLWTLITIVGLQRRDQVCARKHGVPISKAAFHVLPFAYHHDLRQCGPSPEVGAMLLDFPGFRAMSQNKSLPVISYLGLGFLLQHQKTDQQSDVRFSRVSQLQD